MTTNPRVNKDHLEADSPAVSLETYYTADRTQGLDFMRGLFSFSGFQVIQPDRYLFSINPPASAWAEVAYSLSWLHHLRPSSFANGQERAICAEQMRFFVSLWMQRGSLPQQNGADGLESQAKRFLNLLIQAPFFLYQAPKTFRKAFLLYQYRAYGKLSTALHKAPEDIPRLFAALAVFAGAIILPDHGGFFPKNQTLLKKMLSALILNEKEGADGMPLLLNPTVMLDILYVLIALKKKLITLNLSPAYVHLSAIKHLYRRISALRLGDGGLAQFNGTGDIQPDILAPLKSLLPDVWVNSHDIQEVSGSRYFRLASSEGADKTIVICNGYTPRASASKERSSGALSFEMSYATQRMIVNCGFDRKAAPPAAPRQHSTLDVISPSQEKQSPFWGHVSSLFSKKSHNLTQPPLFYEDAQTVMLTLTRFIEDLQCVHSRALRLAKDGSFLEGVDTCCVVTHTPAWIREGALVYALRFHLHPQIAVSLPPHKKSVFLHLPHGPVWIFSVLRHTLSVEDACFMPLGYGKRKTKQIVIYQKCLIEQKCMWCLRKL